MQQQQVKVVETLLDLDQAEKIFMVIFILDSHMVKRLVEEVVCGLL